MQFRVLPIIITAASLLLVLKVAGLVLTGHYAFDNQPEAPKITVAATYRPSAAARSPGQVAQASADMGDENDITGSVPPPKKKKETAPAEAPAAASGGEPATAAKDVANSDKPPQSPGAPISDKTQTDLSPAEKALLQRLQDRRKELDSRATELDLREGLLRAAEKKVDGRLGELQAVQQSITAAEAERKEQEDKQIKDLVVMYENMKPKQAAQIFNQLDMPVLLEVASRMNPKKTSDVLARMTPAAAEKLTVALAKRKDEQQQAQANPALVAPVAAAPGALPKIHGTPKP
ncbi:MotE family protein [Flaviflagellibacter deserti]|uniref:MotE family protein n=1 Tax=Flaviflagellibacter deserti TaxID=2267266 RepID=A0ABV9Z4F6_9HYPH